MRFPLQGVIRVKEGIDDRFAVRDERRNEGEWYYRTTGSSRHRSPVPASASFREGRIDLLYPYRLVHGEVGTYWEHLQATLLLHIKDRVNRSFTRIICYILYT